MNYYAQQQVLAYLFPRVWKEDVPGPRRRRRYQIRSEHWARDFLFCTLIAICHSIHPSSLWLAVNLCELTGGSIDRGESRVFRLWHAYLRLLPLARLHFGILPVLGGSLNSKKPPVPIL
jgi:hypothetical protein